MTEPTADPTADLTDPVEGPALHLVLPDAETTRAFGAALPAPAHLASKAGQLPGLRHDAGILTVADRIVVLAVLADGFTDWQTAQTLQGGEGAALLGQIAREVALGLKSQAQAH